MVPQPGDIVLYHFEQGVDGEPEREIRSRPALVVETFDDGSAELSVFVRLYDRIPPVHVVFFQQGLVRVVTTPVATTIPPADHTWSPLPRRAPC